MTDAEQLAKLRENLVLLENDIESNRECMDRLSARQSWLLEQRSECLKVIARLTIAKRDHEET